MKDPIVTRAKQLEALWKKHRALDNLWLSCTDEKEKKLAYARFAAVSGEVIAIEDAITAMEAQSLEGALVQLHLLGSCLDGLESSDENTADEDAARRIMYSVVAVLENHLGLGRDDIVSGYLKEVLNPFAVQEPLSVDGGAS